MSKSETWLVNVQKRNERIRNAFHPRFTYKPRPLLHSRECAIAHLAEEFFLSIARIEDIVE
ncbi:hypothetical protein [Hymenobacter siberiensis]|uniref:hypothetical protein n=1 Tax=Hymenobacter siberiensis TaxID=2848396 RepID=UPI001C1DFC73|nr:hypothetical protein [Hymenobacter siberiensis]MBU6122237.1 hypothetical protein [Hymenobacter siberiensis]